MLLARNSSLAKARTGRKFTLLSSLLLRSVSHPRRDRLAHTLLEGHGKSAITPETALLGQLLRSERALGCGCLLVEAHKVLEAQTIDIGIISGVLACKIQAEIIAVGSDNLTELAERDVLSQVELSSLAIVFQQLSDVVGNSDLGRTGS